MKRIFITSLICILIVLLTLTTLFIYVARKNHKRWEKRIAPISSVVTGTDSSFVKNKLGEPDWREKEMWVYAEKTTFALGEIYNVYMKDGKVVKVEKYNF